VAEGAQEEWLVLGHGWDANRWEAPPDRQSLDGVVSVPTFLESIDLHAAYKPGCLVGSRHDRYRPIPQAVASGMRRVSPLVAAERASLLVSTVILRPLGC
jgi:hypothetical protein